MQRRLGERTWEARETELGRQVALRRLEPGGPFDATQWPERPGVVRLFAVVEGPAGTYIATTFVPGARTFAEVRRVGAARRGRWLDEVAATLAGTAHGCLTADDILIGADGHAFVTGFGRAPAGATAADDQAALERLRPAPRPAWQLPAAGAAGAVAVAGILVAALGEGGDKPSTKPAPAPPVTQGASPVGSGLAAGHVATLDCEGHPPSGNSQPCTIMQAALPGGQLVVSQRGLVRAFAVRGASGRLRLQVLQRKDGGYTAYNRSRTVTIDDPDTAALIKVDMSVPKGARFGLEVEPGGAVGIRRDVDGAEIRHFFGPVRTSPQPPDPGHGRGEELLLRVDMQPGATPIQP